jgi:hypothetical protein
MEWVEDRKAFAEGFVAEVSASILAAAELKAERERAAGRWDDLKQLRLDGLRDVLAEVEDLSIPALSDILWRHGLRADFKLLDRDSGAEMP